MDIDKEGLVSTAFAEVEKEIKRINKRIDTLGKKQQDIEVRLAVLQSKVSDIHIEVDYFNQKYKDTALKVNELWNLR